MKRDLDPNTYPQCFKHLTVTQTLGGTGMAEIIEHLLFLYRNTYMSSINIIIIIISQDSRPTHAAQCHAATHQIQPLPDALAQCRSVICLCRGSRPLVCIGFWIWVMQQMDLETAVDCLIAHLWPNCIGFDWIEIAHWLFSFLVQWLHWIWRLGWILDWLCGLMDPWIHGFFCCLHCDHLILCIWSFCTLIEMPLMKHCWYDCIWDVINIIGRHLAASQPLIKLHCSIPRQIALRRDSSFVNVRDGT